MKNFSIPLRLVGSICLIGFLCLQCQAVLADEAPVIPPPLFETRYFKEGDPAVTTSKCIGNPVTPLCAADTWINSSAYDDDHLSEIANGLRPGTVKLITKPPYNPVIFCYQVMGYWHFLEDDITLIQNNKFAAGDVAIQIRYGYMKGRVCEINNSGLDDMGLLLRKGKYGWYVINFHPMINYVRSPEFYTNKN